MAEDSLPIMLACKANDKRKKEHMLIKQIIEVFDLLDSPMPAGEEVKAYLQSKGEDDITVKTIQDGNTPRILSKSSSPERMEGLRGNCSHYGHCGAVGCDWRVEGAL